MIGSVLAASIYHDSHLRQAKGTYVADNHSTGAVIGIPALLSLNHPLASTSAAPIEQEGAYRGKFVLVFATSNSPGNILAPDNPQPRCPPTILYVHTINAFVVVFSTFGFQSLLPISRAAVSSVHCHTRTPRKISESKPRTCLPFSELFASTLRHVDFPTQTVADIANTASNLGP